MQGIQGIPGKDGNDYDVQIGNTTTLSPGEDATATTNKDEENNILYLNLGIPKGLTGDKGETGDTYFTTFDVIEGKLIAYYSTANRDYEFRLNENKLEVVFSE